jgi:hypothetical protein
MKPKRAARSPLTVEDAARIKGMLRRGDVQSDIAQYHSCNQGRVVEIRQRKTHRDVLPMAPELLPPPGPYAVVTRLSHERGVIAERVVSDLRRDLREIVAKIERELDSLQGAGLGDDGKHSAV